jgi:hypothetical protein
MALVAARHTRSHQKKSSMLVVSSRLLVPLYIHPIVCPGLVQITLGSRRPIPAQMASATESTNSMNCELPALSHSCLPYALPPLVFSHYTICLPPASSSLPHPSTIHSFSPFPGTLGKVDDLREPHTWSQRGTPGAMGLRFGEMG